MEWTEQQLKQLSVINIGRLNILQKFIDSGKCIARVGDLIIVRTYDYSTNEKDVEFKYDVSDKMTDFRIMGIYTYVDIEWQGINTTSEDYQRRQVYGNMTPADIADYEARQVFNEMLIANATSVKPVYTPERIEALQAELDAAKADALFASQVRDVLKRRGVLTISGIEDQFEQMEAENARLTEALENAKAVIQTDFITSTTVGYVQELLDQQICIQHIIDNALKGQQS